MSRAVESKRPGSIKKQRDDWEDCDIDGPWQGKHERPACIPMIRIPKPKPKPIPLPNRSHSDIPILSNSDIPVRSNSEILKSVVFASVLPESPALFPALPTSEGETAVGSHAPRTTHNIQPLSTTDFPPRTAHNNQRLSIADVPPRTMHNQPLSTADLPPIFTKPIMVKKGHRRCGLSPPLDARSIQQLRRETRSELMQVADRKSNMNPFLQPAVIFRAPASLCPTPSSTDQVLLTLTQTTRHLSIVVTDDKQDFLELCLILPYTEWIQWLRNPSATKPTLFSISSVSCRYTHALVKNDPVLMDIRAQMDAVGLFHLSDPNHSWFFCFASIPLKYLATPL